MFRFFMLSPSQNCQLSVCVCVCVFLCVFYASQYCEVCKLKYFHILEKREKHLELLSWHDLTS